MAAQRAAGRSEELCPEPLPLGTGPPRMVEAGAVCEGPAFFPPVGGVFGGFPPVAFDGVTATLAALALLPLEGGGLGDGKLPPQAL